MKVLFDLPAATIAKCFDPQDLQALARVYQTTTIASEADAIITGWGTLALSDAQIERMLNLRVWVHSAGSVKNFLPASFWSRGIRLATCNEALAIGVAETTLGLIVAGLKGFFPASNVTRAGGWLENGKTVQGWPVRELYGTTIGIIGASQTGRHLIRLLKNFQVKMLLADPYVTQDQARELGCEKVELQELMSQSDVVSLMAPALPETRHMLSRAQFAAMKDNGILINTARGMIVDEDALVAELQTGRIFAFLDVTFPEPPATDHAFRRLPNCVLLPHIAGAVSNGCLRLGRSTVDQLIEFSDGKKMHGEVTQEQIARMA